MKQIKKKSGDWFVDLPYCREIKVIFLLSSIFILAYLFYSWHFVFSDAVGVISVDNTAIIGIIGEFILLPAFAFLFYLSFNKLGKVLEVSE